MAIRADEVEVQKDVIRIFSSQVLIILGWSHWNIAWAIQNG